MSMKIITIGVYGYEEEDFFEALTAANVDLFCDIRARRGVRGSKYAFANSKRLQKRLADLNIHYLHLKDLAPSQSIRQRQYDEDKSKKIAKRKRTELGSAFKAAYEKEILNDFDAQAFIDDLPEDTKTVIFFCVEKEPGACHRSLVAGKLQQELGLEVAQIVP